MQDRGGACLDHQGNLPWVTLGLKGTDAWGQTFTYRVAAEFADDATAATVFDLGSNGDIEVQDAAGEGIAALLPASVVSHGGNGVPSTLELENTDDDAQFIDAGYSRQSNMEFDDLLVWLSPHTLKAAMVQAGRLP